METWLDYKKKFEVDMIKILDQVFSLDIVQKEVIRLNQEQLQNGIDANDKVINTIGGTPYRPYTVHQKIKKQQPTNRVTLYDTGEFYNTFGVKITNLGYEITADFNKGDESILDNFSDIFDFLGLTPESLAELGDNQVLYQFEKLLKKEIGI